MIEKTLTRTRIQAGLWQGLLTGAPTDPDLEATLSGVIVPDLAVAPVPGQASAWRVTVPIPIEALGDGVQTLLIRDRAADRTLHHVTISTGQPEEDELRAEIALLREELDLLKRAFRRHCRETGTQ